MFIILPVLTNQVSFLAIMLLRNIVDILCNWDFLAFKWNFHAIYFCYIFTDMSRFKVTLKAEEPEIKLPTSAGSSKKQESSRKTSISALLTMPKPLTMWITINCEKF